MKSISAIVFAICFMVNYQVISADTIFGIPVDPTRASAVLGVNLDLGTLAEGEVQVLDQNFSVLGASLVAIPIDWTDEVNALLGIRGNLDGIDIGSLPVSVNVNGNLVGIAVSSDANIDANWILGVQTTGVATVGVWAQNVFGIKGNIWRIPIQA